MSTVTGDTGAVAPDAAGASTEQRDTAIRQVELFLGGMTCASCANRIERKLNKLDGVCAAVNFATEKARVAVASDVTTHDLIGAVEAAGHTASVPVPRSAEDNDTEAGGDRGGEAHSLKEPGCSSRSSSRSP